MSRELNQYEQKNANRIITELEDYEKEHGKLSQEAKAYFIYRKMGEIYTYKDSYFLYPTVLEMDDYLEKVSLVKEGMTEDGYGTCGDINEGCVLVMKSVGIDAHLYYWYYESPLAHVDGGFKVGDNYYYFDLRSDLYRIQTGMKSNSFGLSQEELHDNFYDPSGANDQTVFLHKMVLENDGATFTGISDITLKEWDDNFGFTYNGLYTDDVFEMLKTEAMDQKHCEEFFGTSKPDELAHRKFDFVMKYVKIAKNNRSKKIGTVEASSYYTKLLFNLFTVDDFRKYILTCTGFTRENDKRVMQKIVAIKKESGDVFYLYNHETEVYEEIDKKALIDSDILFINPRTDRMKSISEFVYSVRVYRNGVHYNSNRYSI